VRSGCLRAWDGSAGTGAGILDSGASERDVVRFGDLAGRRGMLLPVARTGDTPGAGSGEGDTDPKVAAVGVRASCKDAWLARARSAGMEISLCNDVRLARGRSAGGRAETVPLRLLRVEAEPPAPGSLALGLGARERDRSVRPASEAPEDDGGEATPTRGEDEDAPV
jgi:hypothetical protein